MYKKYTSIILIARAFLDKDRNLSEFKLQLLCFLFVAKPGGALYKDINIYEEPHALDIPRYKALMRNKRLISVHRLCRYLKKRRRFK